MTVSIILIGIFSLGCAFVSFLKIIFSGESMFSFETIGWIFLAIISLVGAIISHGF